MKLGKWLREYRHAHGMTMNDMADACGFSKSYVNLLEKGINPTTQKPVSPTMQTLEKIARATGQDVDSLLKILNDKQQVTINSTLFNVSEEEKKLIDNYRELNIEGRNILWGVIKSLCNTYPEVEKI